MNESTQPSLSNPVLERMRAGQAALGMLVRLGRSGEIARIAKASGHDFLFMDVQHAIFDLETIAHIAGTAIAIGVAPLVRVRGVDDPDVPVLLDNGVSGIVFPDVNTAEEARRAAERCRFAPLGKRSVGGSFPQFEGRTVPVAEAVRLINAATIVVCMIETVEGLANLDEIAAVDGIDVIHVGANDLLVSMGKAGRFDDPAIGEAQDRIIAAAKANGKFAGCGGIRDPKRQAEIIARGVRFVTTQADTAFLAGAAKGWVDTVRA